MNKRIQELAIQAAGKGFETFATSDFDSQAKIQKFAELIIEECLLAISKTKITDEEIPTMIKCHDQVEQHFGVE